MGNDTRGLPSQTIQELAARLATLTDLRLPAQLRRQEQGPSPQERLRYLTQLLLHDPGVFLERHGSSLTSSERLHFHSLRGDYEVDFYLKMLEEQEDQHKRETVARNRRLAYMNRCAGGTGGAAAAAAAALAVALAGQRRGCHRLLHAAC